MGWRLYWDIVMHHFTVLSYEILCNMFRQEISSPFLHFLTLSVCSLCPFMFWSTVDIFVWMGSLGQLMLSSGLGLAGVILSHTGPPINGSIVGSSLRERPWMPKLQQTRREKTTIIWPPSMTRGLCKKPAGGSWLMAEALGVDGWLGRIGVGRMILVHSRELIQGGRKQKRKREAGGWKMELHGEVVFVFLPSSGGMQLLKSS